MRLLITGAGGFVGRHLSVLALSKKKAQVYGLVRSQAASKLVAGVKPVRGDLLSASSMASVLKKVKPERIYHLAGQASVALSWKEPASTLRVNLGGTRSLLEAVRKTGSRARILVVCSADEYGASARSGRKLTEEAPLVPLNPYGRSKVAQDLLAQEYFRTHGLPIVRTRAFNHFGPGQSDRFVVPGFAKQVALIEAGRQKPQIQVGNLEAVRDFTDVRDVVRAYWLALEKGRAGEVYNVAGGRGRRVADVLRFYLGASSVRIKVRRDRSRLRASDMPFLIGDARKLERQTGWKPRIRFETTLRDVLKDWRKKIRG